MRFGMMRETSNSNPHSGSVNREPLYKQGTVALPAIGAAWTPIVQYPVRRGANGWIWKLAIDYVGTGFVEGSGSILYGIFRDPAITKGVKGFTQLTASVGSVNNPVEIPAFPIYEAEVITIAVKNVSLGVGGASVVAAMVGWVEPKMFGARQQWP